MLAFTLGCAFANGGSYFLQFEEWKLIIHIDFMTLSILRGLQGAGASATIPASVCIIILSLNFLLKFSSLVF
jgi:hypothetical protein